MKMIKRGIHDPTSQELRNLEKERFAAKLMERMKSIDTKRFEVRSELSEADHHKIRSNSSQIFCEPRACEKIHSNRDAEKENINSAKLKMHSNIFCTNDDEMQETRVENEIAIIKKKNQILVENNEDLRSLKRALDAKLIGAEQKLQIINKENKKKVHDPIIGNKAAALCDNFMSPARNAWDEIRENMERKRNTTHISQKEYQNILKNQIADDKLEYVNLLRSSQHMRCNEKEKENLKEDILIQTKKDLRQLEKIHSSLAEDRSSSKKRLEEQRNEFIKNLKVCLETKKKAKRLQQESELVEDQKIREYNERIETKRTAEKELEKNLLKYRIEKSDKVFDLLKKEELKRVEKINKFEISSEDLEKRRDERMRQEMEQRRINTEDWFLQIKNQQKIKKEMLENEKESLRRSYRESLEVEEKNLELEKMRHLQKKQEDRELLRQTLESQILDKKSTIQSKVKEQEEALKLQLEEQNKYQDLKKERKKELLEDFENKIKYLDLKIK